MVIGISLLLVLALAKVAVLWDRSIDWSAAAVAGYFWQDALVALVFLLVSKRAQPTGPSSRGLGRDMTGAALGWCYWLLVLYAAINVPVARVLSTPLTWPMLQATRGTLADSILSYVTWTHAGAMALVLGSAAVLPPFLRRAPAGLRYACVAAALVVLAAGPLVASRLDTLGLHRNPVIALGTTVLPRVTARAADGAWTAPPFEAPRGDDFSHLHGLAAGRHVVMVGLESTAAQYLRLYGGADDLTPRLDALARHALVFDAAYATTPESIKGLFSVLCSRYPAFDTPARAYAAPCPSMAAVLGEAGYRTALFHSGRFGYLGMEAVVRERGFETLEDAGDIGGTRESSFGVDEAATVDRMLAWVDSLRPGERFLLAWLPIAGHHPYATPEPGPFPDDDDMGRYRNAVHYGDSALGDLIDAFRARGLYDDTLWIVYGDHGQAFGQHEGNYGHTFFLYEENVRVPFLAAAPGAIDRSLRSRTIVSLVDVAPTMLDLLGLGIPEAYQGGSGLESDPRMALFFTEYSLSLVGLRDGRWKFVHELRSGRSKLFDLRRDPDELIDLSAQQPLRASAYRERLEAWSAAQKARMRNRDSE